MFSLVESQMHFPRMHRYAELGEMPTCMRYIVRYAVKQVCVRPLNALKCSDMHPQVIFTAMVSRTADLTVAVRKGGSATPTEFAHQIVGDTQWP